jgi:site-specific DNA-methyltransferase (adenine-specific)
MSFERVEIGNAVLYRGDCLEILPTLPKVDAVITDPPYGVDFAAWDAAAPVTFLGLVAATTTIVTPGIANMWQWPAPRWLAAYSYPIGLKNSMDGGMNCWEPLLVYGRNTFALDHKQFPPIPSEKVVGHPCPKPLAPFLWIVERATEPRQMVCDPFMGSGTTGVACVRAGRAFIGIEREPKYFDIACRRIEQAMAQGKLFGDEPARLPEQMVIA